MSTMYFTFGYDHVHRIDGRTYDADTVVAITADDPRAVMFSMFGAQWGTSYDEPPRFAVERGLPIVDVIDGPDGRIIAMRCAA